MRRITSRTAALLVTALCAAAAHAAPTPTSRPAAEVIEDGDDDDFPTLTPKVAAKSASVGASGPAEPPVSWTAKAILKLHRDLQIEGARPGQGGDFVEDASLLSVQLFGTLQYKPRKWARLRLGVLLDYQLTHQQSADDRTYILFNGRRHRSDFEALLDDSFVEFSHHRFDAKLGLLTTVWGANDLVNPNDVLSARELRRGVNTEPEALRRPSPSLAIDSYWGALTLSAVWQPIFTPNSVDVFGSDYAAFGPAAPASLRVLGDLASRLIDSSVEAEIQPALLATERPRPFDGSIIGTRVSSSLAGWDVAAQYVFGYERNPRIRVKNNFVLTMLGALSPDGSLTADGKRALGEALLGDELPIAATFARVHQTGISLTRAIGQIVGSLDLAYLSRRALPLGGTLPFRANGDWLETTIDSAVLSYTVGARYTYSDDLIVVLQWWHDLHLDLLELEPIDRPELLLGAAQQGGLALMVQWTWDQLDLSSQLVLHSDFFTRSLIISPQVLYRFSDAIKFGAGANIYAGQPGSLGKLFDHADQVYLVTQLFL